MDKNVVAVGFTKEQQMEIERIVIDGDTKAALDFVKELNNEFRRRERAQMREIC